MKRELESLKRAGINRKSLHTALSDRTLSPKDLSSILYSDPRRLAEALFEELPSGHSLESEGKRHVQAEEIQAVTRYFLRNNCYPEGTEALILTGPHPADACLLWAKAGLAFSFNGYENSQLTYRISKALVEEAEIEVIKHSNPLWCKSQSKVKIDITFGDILKYNQETTYSVMDFDFCNNHLRIPDDRKKLADLVIKQGPRSGPFVLRTTVQVGRFKDNTKEDVLLHQDFFENLLTNRGGFRILYKSRSPYRNMMSLIWILERK